MAVLVAIAGLVALVWGAIVFLRGGLLGGCLAVLLAGILFGHAFWNVPLGPAPLTLDRLLWGLLLVQCVYWRRWGLATLRPIGIPEVVLGLFTAVLLVSTLMHDWHVHNNAPMARFLFYYLMPVGIYWVARQAVLTERSFRLVLGFFTVLGVYLAVTAIAETRQLWWLVYPTYIGSPEYPEFLGRGRGPLLNPSGNGILLGVALVSTLLWWPRVGRAGRVLLLVLAVLLGVGVYSTLTRCVWMGAGLGLAILLGLTLPRAWRFPVLGGGAVAVALLAATHWEELLSFKRDEALGADAAAESVRLRPVLARVAWNMFLDRPLLGCGLGQYESESVCYLHDRSTELVLETARPFCQHNVLLSLSTETGLIGMGLFAILLILWGRDAWRLWHCRSAPPWARQQGLLMLVLLGNYLANGMFQDVSLIAMVNMLLLFMAGLTEGMMAPVVAGSRDAEETRGKPTPLRGRNGNQSEILNPQS